MAVIAVTGAIGAGKSTVSGILARLMKCEVIDADIVAAGLWACDDVKNVAVSRWGSGILGANGEILKQEIARLIFSDENEYRFCNSLIHPLVMRELRERAGKLRAAVIEIPLLPEVGRQEWIDFSVYVSASFVARAERCRLSRGWNDDELLRREKFLLPESQRIEVCDFVIKNESGLKELEDEAVRFLQEINK